MGCGIGTEALHLAEQGYDVTGLDFAETAIERVDSVMFETRQEAVDGILAIVRQV